MSDRKNTLDAKSTVVASKPVKLNGRAYSRGETINDSTVDFRKLNQLYRVGIVMTQEQYANQQAKSAASAVRASVAETAPIEALEATPVEEAQDAQATEVEEVIEEAEVVQEDAAIEDAPRRGRPKKVD